MKYNIIYLLLLVSFTNCKKNNAMDVYQEIPENNSIPVISNPLEVIEGSDKLVISLEDLISTFPNQPFFKSSLGYYIFQPNATDVASRFYIMPKGNPVGTTSKFEMFNTDYNADDLNYNGFHAFINNVDNKIVIGANRKGAAPRLKTIFTGDLIASNIEADSPHIVFEIDDILELKSKNYLPFNVDTAKRKPWTIFEAFQLGDATVIAGRKGSSTSEFLNNAYYDGSWKRISDGFSHRYSMDNTGSFVFWTAPTGISNSVITWTKKLTIKNNGTINLSNLEVFTDESSATSGGLLTNDIYATPTGELRIKL